MGVVVKRNATRAEEWPVRGSSDTYNITNLATKKDSISPVVTKEELCFLDFRQCAVFVRNDINEDIEFLRAIVRWLKNMHKKQSAILFVDC